MVTSAKRLYNTRIVSDAENAGDAAITELLSSRKGERGVHVTAPAGAGKSHLISKAAGIARRRRLRVAVAAPTNEQAFGLVRTIAGHHCGNGQQVVTFVPARAVSLPDAIRRLPGVQECDASDAARENLIVGTLSKLGDAFARGNFSTFDVLLIDESYQADAGKYYAVGDLAPVHLLVGDGGQISPFSTIDDPCRWRGLSEDPLQTAVGVLRRNHPHTAVYGLPITRRLDDRAVSIARLFYPALSFGPAVLPGVREVRLGKASGSQRFRKLDAALDLAACEGWTNIELPHVPVLQADPGVVNVLTDLIHRLFNRQPEIRCERHLRFARLEQRQVAVGVSHNDQKDFLRVALGARGLDEVVVETANKLQGLEFEIVFVWHPLSGLPEADAFHLDPGRLCVLLTRHRQACIVVGRVGDRDLLAGQVPPATEAYLGWDPDPVLDGWEVHQDVFSALEPHILPI